MSHIIRHHNSTIARRHRRARRSRGRIHQLPPNKRLPRLCVHRSAQHMAAQVTTDGGAVVLASASTLDKAIRKKKGAYLGNVAAASQVGKLIAQRCKKAGIETIAFDRSGYKYHGRVKALAQAAREAGLNF